MTGLVANVYAAIFTPVPLATLALGLRLKARRMTRMGMGYDDGLAIAAWVLAIGYTADLIVWATSFKLGRKIGLYSEERVEYYMEKSYLVLWVSELLYAWSIFFAKLAVLFFYRRVFKFSSIRIPIIIVMSACCIWIVLRTFFTIFRCLPVQAYWDRSIEDAKCFTNVRAFYLGTDTTHCLMDFIILGLPIIEVVKIQMPFGQKIAVVCLFASGTLVGIASIFQIVHSQQYDPTSNELPYDLALSMVWGNVELHMAVFVGSLTLLRPIFRKLIPGLHSATSHVASHPSRASSSIQPTAELRQTSSPRKFHQSGSMDINLPAIPRPALTESGQKEPGLNRGSFCHREYRQDS